MDMALKSKTKLQISLKICFLFICMVNFYIKCYRYMDICENLPCCTPESFTLTSNMGNNKHWKYKSGKQKSLFHFPVCQPSPCCRGPLLLHEHISSSSGGIQPDFSACLLHVCNYSVLAIMLNSVTSLEPVVNSHINDPTLHSATVSLVPPPPHVRLTHSDLWHCHPLLWNMEPSFTRVKELDYLQRKLISPGFSNIHSQVTFKSSAGHTGKLAKQVKTPTTKPAGQSSISRTHMVAGENRLSQAVP